ncbi:hypothetical protein Tco_1312281 [Tanacetum coccineum]
MASSITRFDIKKFDGKNDFGLWKIKMGALMVHQGCDAVLETLPADMEAGEKDALMKKAYSTLNLEFGRIQIEDEDQTLMLLTSLPSSYENFVETLWYRRESLTMKDVLVEYAGDLGLHITSCFHRLKMDNPNITMEEYIRLQEENALSRGETFNWQTATYGKMEYYEDEDDCFTNFKTKFPAIVLDNTLTSDATISCGPTISPLNDNEIDFRISFNESDDEDNTPEVSYSNDLDFFKDFENEFPTIVYNDTLTSKSDFFTEHIVSPQHIDEFNNETSLSECDEKEQNILYFNDLFPFNVIYPNDLKSDTDNDNDKIDIEQPLGDMSIIPLSNEPYGDLAETMIWYILKKTCVELIQELKKRTKGIKEETGDGLYVKEGQIIQVKLILVKVRGLSQGVELVNSSASYVIQRAI